MMSKKRVLITGTGGRSVGSGIAHALLTPQARKRWDIICADADPFAWGLYKAPQAVLLPLASHPDYIKVLKKLINIKNIDAIIPGTEPEVQACVKHRKILQVPVIANEECLLPLMMDKSTLQGTLEKLGLPFIDTKPIAQWATMVKKYGFPLVVKPTVNTGASRGLNIIANGAQMKEALRRVDQSSRLAVQPYVGSHQQEYTVGVLTDKGGAMIDSIVMHRKLVGLSLHQLKKIDGKEHAISSGYSQGFIIKHPFIQSFCENLAMKLESKGPLNIQLRLHQGVPYVFEIHPRFSGTTPIRADVGFNEVDILLRNFLGCEKFGRLKYQVNVAAIRAFGHVIVPMEEMLIKGKT